MKAKSPSSGGKVFLCNRVSEAFVGKGPGRCRQPAGEGCEETVRSFPPLALSRGTVPPEGQGPEIMGQRPLEKSKGVDLCFSASGLPFLSRFRVASEVDQVV